MNSKDSLIKTLIIIESCTPSKVSIDFLSQQVNLSSSHLQKLFKIATGQPLMEYVRGRKLARSLEAILNTNLRIIDIANDYGFQHEQSYIRAFYKEFGCTPGVARKNGRILPIRERIVPEQLQSSDKGFIFGPEMVMVPSFYVIGKPHIFSTFDSQKDGLEPNKLAKQFYYDEMSRIPNVISHNVYIGHVKMNSRFNHTENIEYMPSVQVKDLSCVPTGLKGKVIPSHQCVRFRYVGEHHYEEISMVSAHDTYREIDSFFTGQSRYVTEYDYFIERMDIGTYDGVYCQMEWLFPVKDTIK